MSTLADAAGTLHAFACRAAESRMLVVRGSVSTPIDVPVATTLAIVHGGRRLHLVGDDRDAAFGDVTASDVAEALSDQDAVIEAGSVRFPIRGDLTVERIADTTLMMKVLHRRSNGQPSGAVDRMILTILHGSAL